MNAEAVEREPSSPDGMADAVRKQQERRKLWRTEGEPSVVRFVGQIGVLGWIIVAPTLIGLFIGRWLDHGCAAVFSGARHCWCWALRSGSGRPGDGCTGNDGLSISPNTRCSRCKPGHGWARRADRSLLFPDASMERQDVCPWPRAAPRAGAATRTVRACSPSCLPLIASRFGALPLLLAAAGILAARTAAVRLGEQT